MFTPTGCKYNQVNSHFHCIREGCQFSFLLKHQMTSHARKHMRRMLGKNFDRVPPSQVRAPHSPRGSTVLPLRCRAPMLPTMPKEPVGYYLRAPLLSSRVPRA